MAGERRVVEVAGGIVYRDGRVLAARRASGELAGGWEFPGGKLAAGGVHVGVAWPYDEVTHDYGETRVHMTLVVCPLAPGEEPVADPAVHDALRWLSHEELLDVEWVAADEPVARSLGTFWDATFDPVHL